MDECTSVAITQLAKKTITIFGKRLSINIAPIHEATADIRALDMMYPLSKNKSCVKITNC